MIDYSGLDFYAVLDLPYDLFLAMRKRHYVDGLNATEKGREYLRDAQRLTQTEPDYKALRKAQEDLGGGMSG